MHSLSDAQLIDLPNHLNGMYAFCFYRHSDSSIWLFRDPLSKKPLYLYRDSTIFVACSSLRLIKKYLADINIITGDSSAGIVEYSTLGYNKFSTIYSGILPFSGVSKFCSLNSAYSESLSVSSAKYINSFFDRVKPLDRQPLAASTLHLELLKSVQIRSPDQSIPLLFSGGVDSSLLLSLLLDLGKKPVLYTINLGDQFSSSYDLHYSRRIASYFSLDLYEIELQDLPDLPDYISSLDSPFAEIASYLIWSASKIIRRHGFRYCLVGDGADELFGGYSRYKFNSFRFRLSDFLFRILGSKLSYSFLTKLGKFADILSPSLRSLSIYGRYSCSLSSEEAVLSQMYDQFREFPAFKTSLLNSLRFLDLNTYLSGNCNLKADLSSMSVPLELRSPFQDLNILKLVSSNPHYYYNSTSLKLCLNQILLRLKEFRWH